MIRLWFIITALIFTTFATDGHAQGIRDQERVAIAYEQAGDWRNAARLWQEMLSQQPTNPRYLVGALRSLKMIGQTEAIVQLVKSSAPEARSWESLAYYGYALWRMGQEQQATSAWDQSLEQIPGQQEPFYRTIASLQLDAGARALAARTFRIGRQKIGRADLFSEDLAQLAIAAREPNAALDEIFLHFRTTQNLSRTQGYIATLLSMDGTAKIVRERVEQFAKENDSWPLALRLYEWTLRELGEYRTALDVVIRLERLTGQSGRELYAFAERARTEGALDVALDAYRALQTLNVPIDIRTMALFGRAQAIEQRMLSSRIKSQNELEQLKKEYETIAREFPTHPLAATALLRIAQLERDYGSDTRGALHYFDVLAERYPATEQAARGLLERLPLIVELYGLDSAVALFEHDLPRISSHASLRLQAAYTRGELDFFRCRFGSALAYYQQATANLDDPIANDAIERITLLTSNKEDSLWLCVLAQAEREFYQRKFELGFRLVDSLAAMPSDIAEQALLHAASIALDQGIDSTSSRYWNMLLTQYPETLYGDRILWGLAIIAQRSGNTEEALSLYNQLLARYPNSILVPQTRSQIRMLRGQM